MCIRRFEEEAAVSRSEGPRWEAMFERKRGPKPTCNGKLV